MMTLSHPKLSVPKPPEPIAVINNNLNLESRIEELPLSDFKIECSFLGRELAKRFEENPSLPGAILIDEGRFVGMISRRRFLEQMSRPYALELFSRRPLKFLYPFLNTNALILPSNTLIVEAAKQSLHRPVELLYDPIIVQLATGVYKLVDVHQLLVAQSQIHELTSRLLNEQTQAQMLQTEKMASLGRMVAGIAHEIRNPVNFLCGNLAFIADYSQTLINILKVYEQEIGTTSPKVTEIREEFDLDFVLEDLLKISKSMAVGGDQLKKIINGLQNFSRMDEAKPQMIDVHECIESTLLILNNKLKHEIKLVKNYTALPEIKCYPGQISQVFMNIISNAIDALMENLCEKKLDSQDWQPKIEITTGVLQTEICGWVSVIINDNGCGIPAEIQSQIFETFFTTKPIGKGTGLGLAISHQIVTEKHGGKLLVRSQPKIGTEFEILLPIV